MGGGQRDEHRNPEKEERGGEQRDRARHQNAEKEEKEKNRVTIFIHRQTGRYSV